METITFKISQNWDCIKSLDELINDAKFIFQNDGYKGRRPRIVLNSPIDGFDVIELDYDRYGLTTNAIAKFNTQWGESITDSSKEVTKFIEQFLRDENLTEFILYGNMDLKTFDKLHPEFKSGSEV